MPLQVDPTALRSPISFVRRDVRNQNTPITAKKAFNTKKSNIYILFFTCSTVCSRKEVRMSPIG